MAYYPEPVARLIEALQRLPGIGPKTAQRLTFFLLKRPAPEVAALGEALDPAQAAHRALLGLLQRDRAGSLSHLHAIRSATSGRSAWSRSPTTCSRSSAPASSAAATTCCWARSPRSTASAPRICEVRELLARLDNDHVEEVILATNPSVEGEATAIYLARLLKPLGMRITRIARGLPVGGDLEYADEVTLSKAMEGRREMG